MSRHINPMKRKDFVDPLASIPIPDDIQSVQLGAWRVLLQRPPSWWATIFGSKSGPQTKVRIALRNVVALFKDVYRLGRRRFVIVVLSHVLSGARATLALWTTNRLLLVAEKAVRTRGFDSHELQVALAANVAQTLLIPLWDWFQQRVECVLSNRVDQLFRERQLQARLNSDLATYERNTNRLMRGANPRDGWAAFIGLVTAVKTIFATISSLLMLSAFSSSVSSKDLGLAIFLAAFWPTIRSLCRRQLDSFFAYVTYAPLRRLDVIQDTIQTYPLKAIIGDGLSEYFMQELRKARDAMGNVNSQDPISLYERSFGPWMNMLDALVCNLPLMLYASQCVKNDGNTFPLACMTTLQRVSDNLLLALNGIIYAGSQLQGHINTINQLYADIPPRVEDRGVKAYTPIAGVGMGIQLRNVSFRYPTADDNQLALKGVSFTINPSSLVVIVGQNGSGKSSLVNLLSGLYRPTSGDILIDGEPMEHYISSDLRNVTALVPQDGTIFGFSIGENIGIGDPACAHDLARIEDAARRGCSWDFIQQHPRGLDDELYPPIKSYSRTDENEFLSMIEGKMHRRKDVSGGQRQRLVLSRAFMRLGSGRIKLAVMDEPTSALDCHAEAKILDELLRCRAGKTMIFVTHRFQGLTEQADLILCMKDGELAESGTHSQLMNLRGEYANLYLSQVAPTADQDSNCGDSICSETESSDEEGVLSTPASPVAEIGPEGIDVCVSRSALWPSEKKSSLCLDLDGINTQ